MEANMQTKNHFDGRAISKRIYISGTIVVQSPAILTAEPGDSGIDLLLFKHPEVGRPMITGTAMAGILRHYLRSRLHGFYEDGGPEALQKLVFGKQERDEGQDSWLITYDALADEGYDTEIRDSVGIDDETATAVAGAKFNYEILLPGATFPFRAELLIPHTEGEDDKETNLRQGTAIALQGLEKNELYIGAKTNRGFGKLSVKEWQVYELDLTTLQGLLDWLNWQ